MTSSEIPAFERSLFDPARRISRIGTGSLGGKAHGLVAAARILDAAAGRSRGRRASRSTCPPCASSPPPSSTPSSTATACGTVLAEEPSDQAVALAFQRATLPTEWLGDLRSVADDARVPLACRSSSTLEDALGRPFAGVYGTKMIRATSPT